MDGALRAQHRESQASQTGLKFSFSPYHSGTFSHFEASTKMKMCLTSRSQTRNWKKLSTSPLQVSIPLKWAGDRNVSVCLVYLVEVKL